MLVLCIDRRLQMVAKIAFSDVAGSLYTMKMRRELVSAFSHSALASNSLAALQTAAEPSSKTVCLIYNITTSWWPTYSMGQRLLRLRFHIESCTFWKGTSVRRFL